MCFAACVNFLVVLLSCSGNSDTFGTEIDLLPVQVTEDGNWSMLNSNGEIIYDGEFKNAPTPAVEGVFAVLEGDLYTLYKTGDKSPKTFEGYEGLKSVGYMSEGVIPVAFPHERIQLVDRSGKKICELRPVDGNEIARCGGGFRDGLLAVSIVDEHGSKWGFVDKKGNVVIKPQYLCTQGFYDGVAVCAMKEGQMPDELSKASVIDKTGQKLFDIDSDMQPFGHFIDGHLILCGANGNYVVDKAGKKTKLPSKIKAIYDFDGRYILFANADSEYGVADIDGEILIRPKYEEISFGLGDKFIAKKSGKDELLVLDSKGEVVDEFDYRLMVPLCNWAYGAKEGKRLLILGDDLKQITTEEFCGVFGRWELPEIVESDYFPVDELADVVVKNLKIDGFDKYILGQSAAVINKGADPGIVTMKALYSGFRYYIHCETDFSKHPTMWNDGKYVWNDEALLDRVKLSITLPDNDVEETFNLIAKKLVEQGYKQEDQESLYSDSAHELFFSKNGVSETGVKVGLNLKMNYLGGSPINIVLTADKPSSKMNDSALGDSVIDPEDIESTLID